MRCVYHTHQLHHYSHGLSDLIALQKHHAALTIIHINNCCITSLFARSQPLQEAAAAAGDDDDEPNGNKPGDTPTAGQYEEKNIRRRVYDALNVLLALNIISKDRKTIRWVGVPSDAAHTVAHLEREGVSDAPHIRYVLCSIYIYIVQYTYTR
jgi:E2F/DP family winged-helix DNA-binding domain